MKFRDSKSSKTGFLNNCKYEVIVKSGEKFLGSCIKFWDWNFEILIFVSDIQLRLKLKQDEFNLDSNLPNGNYESRKSLGYLPHWSPRDWHEMREVKRFLLSRFGIQSHIHAELYGPRKSVAGRPWGKSEWNLLINSQNSTCSERKALFKFPSTSRVFCTPEFRHSFHEGSVPFIIMLAHFQGKIISKKIRAL